jgi:hypothetical protein
VRRSCAAPSSVPSTGVLLSSYLLYVSSQLFS